MRAIIPGSFDPVTTGHMALIERAAVLFDSVTVLLCHNFDKKTLFDFGERLEILQAALDGLDNVEADTHEGWLYEYLKAQGSCVLFKGLRNGEDFEYEKKMAEFNLEHSGVESIFVLSEPDLIGVSSTKVRLLLQEGGDWHKYVPQNAQKMIEKFYKKQ